MLLFWASTAFGHGGPPNSEKLLWGPSDDALVVSTHGFVFEDEGWNWVCEELFGDSLPTDVILTPSTILVAGTAGLAHSEDGCAWDWNAQFKDELIWDLAVDPTISSRV